MDIDRHQIDENAAGIRGSGQGLSAPAGPISTSLQVSRFCTNMTPTLQLLGKSMRKIGPNKSESIEVRGLSRLEDTLAIVDRKLNAHGYKVRYDWVSARLLVLRNILLAVGGLAVFTILAAVTIKELGKDTTSIEPVDVAADLERDGLTPRVLAKQIYDELVRIQTIASANVNRKTIAPSAWKLDNSLTIPETKLTVGALFSYLRSQLGWHSQIIDSELMKVGDNLQLRVRVRGKPHATFTGTRDKLDELLRQGAEHIYLSVEPMVLAIYYRFSGNPKGAVEAAKKAALSSNVDEAAVGLAEWGYGLALQGNAASAYEKYKESIRLKPTNSSAYDGMRVIVSRLGKFDEYKAALTNVVKAYPRFAAGHTYLAEVFYNEGDFDQSAKLAEKGLALEPENIIAWYYTLQKKLEVEHDTIDVLDKAMALLKTVRSSPYPFAPGAVMQLVAMAQVEARDFDAAHTTIRDYIQERPGDVRGHQRLAHLHVARHDYDSAFAAMNDARRLGVDLFAYYDIPIKYRREGIAAAEAEAATLLKRRPKYFKVMEALGSVYLAAGNGAMAAQSFRQATEAAPGWPSGWVGLGHAALLTGDLREAMSSARKALTLSPKWAAPHVLLGDIALAQKNEAKAIDEYQQAIKLDPKWGEPYFKWGKVLQGQGDEPGAKDKSAMAYKLEPFNETYKKLSGQ